MTCTCIFIVPCMNKTGVFAVPDKIVGMRDHGDKYSDNFQRFMLLS